ncbi:MAG: uracil-DNA glycosylase [Pseudomonadota bacterium]
MRTSAAQAAPPEAPFDCALCPRLVEYREANRAEEPGWHNAPVASFGDEAARLLIVGLAPGRTGANRTARPFTGDWAGDLLYPTLAHFGLSAGDYDRDGVDDLHLVDAMITNAVRCAPPANKVTGAEANACRPFLTARIASLKALKCIIALGTVAHQNTLRALGQKPAHYRFGHGEQHALEGPHGPVLMIDSYHCSRYNTNTGRLTEAMFHDVFRSAKAVI